MRAVECVVPKCTHLHAVRDTELVGMVMRHVQEAHPDVAFDERAARSLVDEASYEDLKHGRKKSLVEAAARADLRS